MSPAAAAAVLPPRPAFTPADVRGNLAEAMQLRCIGAGQPIKASWLCRETLEIFRRDRLPADLELVATLRLLVLCYTDDIKRGSVATLGSVDEALAELAALGGIPDVAAVHLRARREPSFDPLPDLRSFRVRVPSSPEGDPVAVRTPRMRMPVARLPAAAARGPQGPGGVVALEGLAGAEPLVAEPVRRQARFERLYLHGVVFMSQAYRVERAGGSSLLDQELPFLVEGAWWMHLAALVARECPVEPAECWRKARAKSSMLIRRIETGKHFEMPTLEALESLE